jgi:hypothetical protein
VKKAKLGVKAVPNRGYCNRCRPNVLRLDVFAERNCKYLQAVPEPTRNEEGSQGQETEQFCEMVCKRCKPGYTLESMGLA